jgi:hypothetical protein
MTKGIENIDTQVVMKKKRELNKLTLKANLNFNVNSFRNWMKQKLIDDGKTFDNNGVKCLPKFSGSHIALTAMNEKLCQIILQKTIERLTKDKTGLYNIRFKDLSDVVKVDVDLKKNLYQYMDIYDGTLNYKDQYCIDGKCMKKYIDKVFSASVDISNDAFNLLVYLLLKTCVRIIDSAFIMIQFAKKRSLNPNVILGSMAIHFSGTIEHLLRMGIEEAVKLCGKEMEEVDDENKDEEIAVEKGDVVASDNEDEDDGEDETDKEDAPEKSTKPEPAKKKK